jgi:hypothetical protein
METLEVQMPLVSRQRFADLVGVTLDTVNKWCDRGYVPTIPMGRWSLINLALVNARCLDQEFKTLDTNIVSLRAHRTDATARSA